MTDMSHERRLRRRYRLELPVRYHVLKKDQSLASGVGFSRDISSGGVAVAVDAELPLGSTIELWVTWPAVDDLHSVELRVAGRVVRSSQTEAAIQIKRHDFVSSRKSTAIETGGGLEDGKAIGRTGGT